MFFRIIRDRQSAPPAHGQLARPCGLLALLAFTAAAQLPWPAFAADDHGGDTSAWQMRDPSDRTVWQSSGHLARGQHRTTLHWKAARSAGRTASSIPRGPDDPFHDPFGDRANPPAPTAAGPVDDLFASEPPTRSATPAAVTPESPTEDSPDIVLVGHVSPGEPIEPEPTPADPRTAPREFTPKAANSDRPPAPRSFRIAPSLTESAAAADQVPSPLRRTEESPPRKGRPDQSASARGGHGTGPVTPRRPRDLPPQPSPSLGRPEPTTRQSATRSRGIVQFRISDPASQSIRQAGYEDLDDGQGTQEQPAEPLEDLFSPQDEPTGPEEDSFRSPPPQPNIEPDFNRPFESEAPLQPEDDREELAPGMDGLPDGTEELGSGELDSLLPPEDPSLEDRDTSACHEIYNDRNCCDEQSECRERIEMLRTKSIRTISMNISPPFDPLAESPEIRQQRQTERLAKAPSRRWCDKQGQLLAEGRLVDIRYGEVIIQQENGQELPLSGLLLGRDERCFISAWWNLPNDCIPDEEPFPIRDFTLTTFTWTASALCHRPLYFEDVQLERYGHSAGPVLQTFMSGAHFYSSIALLPYNMGLYPPKECMYALGYYRPGNCAPWLVSAFPISKRAILAEATAIFALYGFLH